ncbi:hypothetical protein ZWY2020_000710 [Hordeum vulgare]|nr:hypothetical protein ZWY2020_000710 [Hordeum vulgare]
MNGCKVRGGRGSGGRGEVATTGEADQAVGEQRNDRRRGPAAVKRYCRSMSFLPGVLRRTCRLLFVYGPEHVTAQLINREAQQRGPSLPERPHDAARILHAPTHPTAPPPPSPPTSLPSGRIGETSSPASRRPLLPRRPRATAAALRVRAPGQPQPRASAQESKFH